MFDAHGPITVEELLAPATVTADGNGTGVDCKDYIGIGKAVLHCAQAGAGVNPTMDVKLQESDDNSSFSDISGAAFTQVTDAADSIEGISVDFDKTKRYIRAVKDIGGTSSPSFILSAALHGRKQVV